MPQQAADTLWEMLARVTLGLCGMVAGTRAVKGAVAAVRKSREWLVEQIRDSLRKEMK